MNPNPRSASYRETTPSPPRAGGPDGVRGPDRPAFDGAGGAVARAAHEANVAGLRPLVAGDGVVGHAVALGQLGQPAGQCPDVDEGVLAAGLGGDEPEALVGVVPGHGAVGAVGRHGVGGGLGPERQQVVGLRPLLPVDDQERHPLILGDHPTAHDGRAVHEDLGATAIGHDEAVSLARLVPGDGAEHPQGGARGLGARDPDAACLRPPVALTHLELDDLPLPEHPRPVTAHDLGRVHEEVLLLVPAGEEAEAPLRVEPSDSSLGHGGLLVERCVAASQSP